MQTGLHDAIADAEQFRGVYDIQHQTLHRYEREAQGQYRAPVDMSSLVEGGEIIEGLGDRVLGRVALVDVRDPYNDDIIVRANHEIDEAIVETMEASAERTSTSSGAPST